jgi:hypothetical protein
MPLRSATVLSLVFAAFSSFRLVVGHDLVMANLLSPSYL